MDAYQQLIDFLDKNEASYRLIDHEPEGRCDLVSEMRGNTLGAAAKCIMMMVKLSKKEKRYVLGVVPGDAKMNLAKVKELYGGTYASFADKGKAELLSGCVSGTILPINFNEDVYLIVEPRLFEYSSID